MVRPAVGILCGALTALAAQAGEALETGEIRRIDLEARRITITHHHAQGLDVPAMTMVYRVRSPSLVDGLKPGDAVRFQAERLGSVLVVTRIEAAMSEDKPRDGH